jgi:hypothetical protein
VIDESERAWPCWLLLSTDESKPKKKQRKGKENKKK